MTTTRELARYKLDLVGVQGVRWDRESAVRAGDYILFYGKGKQDYNWRKDCLYTTE